MFVSPAFAETATAPATVNTETGTPEHGGFPPFEPVYFPSQILWLAIVFSLFYVFLKRVALPRVGRTLETRRDRIAQDLDRAASMKNEADAAIAAYEQELVEARRRAAGIAQEAHEAARKEADARRAEIEASLDAKLLEAEQRITTIKQAAMQDVGTIAADTVREIVRRLIGASVKDDEAKAAVESVD
jgi:F-type H+-transporting ATPase subunit b